ncbi:integration host factor subunit alpha [Microvirga calopogonii]|uniref:integration host factor subunit alpha n=1 Tax=Microvirga calopogonii TaxID=2078013 RepID=UPI000E0DB360|nr:integration host factor subunit alpha [Microvirga calopogonii]
MAGKSVTRADLTRAVYQQGFVTMDDAADLVDQVLKTISTALEDGENVKLWSFGIFRVRKKAKRLGRNPKSGVEVPIEPRGVIQFSASPVLKSRLNRASPPRSGLHARDADGRKVAHYGTGS